MTNVNVDDLAQIIRQVDGNHDLGAGALAEAILDRLPTPQIIRTVEEQEALDLDTLLMSRKGYLADAEDNIRIPAVVVATAEQVRAARKALEEA
ncbi:hypothetical protein CVAR_0839 [Corynebacterium variabile DSM 44702]|uniref:Uncharacterized protein n=1 Tax=Corynebacterium variabile (strain DSM 44702 / CIP 107183 / JCM 12073 / NCIMB 30131) TaxID=858619 RepID=G0HB68_CORVD|nr:hypothetical protein [Corynebacterium variabile]AEK36193.1 hypothetical protein CVAR_0839 [Corynebacterium variabile DSM 44702]